MSLNHIKNKQSEASVVQVALLKDEIVALELKLITTQKRDAADLGVLRDDFRRLEERLEAEKRDKNLVEVIPSSRR